VGQEDNEFIGEFPGQGGTFSLDVEKLGSPGLSHTLYIVDQRAGEDRGPEPSDTSPRLFHMWASLVQQEPIYDADLAAQPRFGNTLVEMNAAGFGLRAGMTPDGGGAVDMRFHANEAGRLAGADAHLRASTWEEARSKFLFHLNTMLSIFAWDHQLPLAAARVGGRDGANGISYVDYTAPLRVDRKFVAPGISGLVGADVRAAYSFFREGLSNPSPAYRIICFDKALSMLRRIQSQHTTALVQQKADIAAFSRAVNLLVEATDLAVEVWPEVTGWKLHRLHDKKLRPLRNEAAHELLDDGDGYTNLDWPDRRRKFQRAAQALVPLVHRYGSALASAIQRATTSAASVNMQEQEPT